TSLHYFSGLLHCFDQRIEYTSLPSGKATEIMCHKNRGCNMEKYYDSNKCELEEKCMQPDKSSYICHTDMELKAIFLDNENWESIESTSCVGNNFIVNHESEGQIIPLFFRCVKAA
ncbi:hypothetical protein PFISCL1PPCAC_7573, partial [Pristionchus fissidentatus]